MSEFFRALEQANKDRQDEVVARRRSEATADPMPEAAAAATATITATPRTAAPAERREAPVVMTTVTDDAPEFVDDRLVSLLNPTSFAAEQYRTLRHLVEQMRSASGLSVVAVSSPGVGEGKTTTAINLAGALAQSRGTRVLLVDLDLRRSAVTSLLGVKGLESKGLVDIIVTGATLSQAVITLPMFNLAVLPVGERQAAPYDLLKSPRLHEVLAEARTQYDYIVIDTPPLVGVPDCRVISGCVDGFLVVVNAHKTPMKILGEALSVMDPSKVLGLIFNGDERVLGGTAYQAYGPSHDGANAAGWSKAVRRVRQATRRATAQDSNE
jgi:capsular exopolysaccharide synthesis family protein